jgi:hypothetical protein
MEFITPVQKLHSSSLNQMGVKKPIQKKCISTSSASFMGCRIQFTVDWAIWEIGLALGFA